jgi:hypothetical protein
VIKQSVIQHLGKYVNWTATPSNRLTNKFAPVMK